MTDPRPVYFTEPEWRRLLTRAAELDNSSSDRLSLPALRAIAEQAGIGADALEAAIREQAAAPAPDEERLLVGRVRPDLPKARYRLTPALRQLSRPRFDGHRQGLDIRGTEVAHEQGPTGIHARV